jgi:putative ABC transport system permease protein
MFNELGKQAYSALRHNRRRSLLTMLGMAWGIATVVLLLAYGSGFERGLMIAFETFGGNFIAIFPGRTSLQAGGSKAGTEVKLTVQDLDYLQTEVPFIKRMSPEVNKQSLVAYGTRSASYDVRGTYASYQKIRHVDVAEGTFFGEQEDFTHSRVAVLGYDVKKKLFSGQNAIGENVRIDGVSYVVVGILKHMISNGDDNMNAMIYVPFSALRVLKTLSGGQSPVPMNPTRGPMTTLPKPPSRWPPTSGPSFLP